MAQLVAPELVLDTQAEVKQVLRDQMDDRLEDLLVAFTDPRYRPKDRVEAVLEFSILAVAKEALHPHKDKPWAAPGWLRGARADIRSFVDEEPEERNVLLKTIFFNKGRRQDLNRAVFSGMRSAEDLKGKAFAAAVLKGEVIVVPPPSKT